MTDSFDDLKISPALLAGVEAMDWDAPAGLQNDATAVVRRGNNVVLHGSAGSGVMGAYALGILDRLHSADEPAQPAALVLAAGQRTAAATADSLARLAAPAELTVRALDAGWAERAAHVLVATPSAALAAVRASELKLDAVDAVVIDGATSMAGTEQWPALETLIDAVPAGAQRVLVTGELDETINGFVERHVRKAMTVPPRSEPQSPSDSPAVRYAVVPESEKPAAAVRLLGEMDADQIAVVCRTVGRAETVERALADRGVEGIGDRVLVLPRTEADQRSIQARVLSYDVPFDADEMDALHGHGGGVLVTPRERAHLLRIAGRARRRTEAVALPTAGGDAVDALRARLRELVDGDITAELALIEPLLAELPAAEVAAAALKLSRAGTAPAAPSPSGQPAGTAPPPGAGTWVHLFMTIGSRDDVGPGDIVGAITGEAGISGDKVGKIDIRESHSTVEVATEAAGRVIEALNGRTLKGRSLRVDYDRKDRKDRKDRAGGRGRAGSGR